MQWMDLGTFLLGAAILLLCGEWVVRQSLRLAQYYKLSGTVVGLSILSIGTSFPEIVTHVVGSYKILESPDEIKSLSAILLGTNIGSDIVQQDFLIPLVGLLGSIRVLRKNLYSKMGALIVAALFLYLLCLDGHLGRWDGLLLSLSYLLYLFMVQKKEHNRDALAQDDNFKKSEFNPLISWSSLVIGFILMAISAHFVLKVSERWVNLLPISSSFLGVIILGTVSAFPELVTSVISLRKGKKNVSAGVLIGSNITNPLLGIGIGALISTYTVPVVIYEFDLPVKIVTAGLLLIFFRTSEVLTRLESAIVLLSFIAYIVLRPLLYAVDTF